MFGGKFENFLAHDLGSFVDGIPRNDRTAAGECPRAPIELIRVTRDDIDLVHTDAELLRDNLREAREVTLSLRAYAGDYRDAPTAHHLHLGALIGSDAGAFYIRDHPNANVPAFG